MSEICLNDLSIADRLSIPLIAVMMQPCKWPPEGVQYSVKKSLSSLKYIDATSDDLLNKNISTIVNLINSLSKKIIKSRESLKSRSILVTSKFSN